MISLPLSFSLSSRKVCKYIVRVLLFSMLLTKIIVLSILSMPAIFSSIRKLRSLTLKLVIETMVYVIFRRFKSFWYRYTRFLRFSFFQIYSSIFGVIVTETAMIGIFGITNWRIPILLNSLQNSFQPHIKEASSTAI